MNTRKRGEKGYPGAAESEGAAQVAEKWGGELNKKR